MLSKLLELLHSKPVLLTLMAHGQFSLVNNFNPYKLLQSFATLPYLLTFNFLVCFVPQTIKGIYLTLLA